VASASRLFARAVGWHRHAGSCVLDLKEQLQAMEADEAVSEDAAREQLRWSTRLHQLAEAGLHGWLGQRLGPALLDLPVGEQARPDRTMYIRLGDARLFSDSGFAAIVPFLGSGHIGIDTDVRDPAVAAWYRGILLRAVAALPDGALRVLPVDGATLGAVFTPFRALVDAEAWAAPAADLPGLRAALTEAETQINAAQAGAASPRTVLLLAIAAPPAGAGRSDWARLAAVAHAGPAARVHLLVAGYPPDRSYDRPPRLEHTTQLSASAEAGWFSVSDPPGRDKFSVDGSGLAAPVRLDTGASEDMVVEVCGRVGVSAAVSRRTDFAGLMPGQLWQESSAGGLRTVVGRSGREPFTLALDDTTPHMQVAGRSGAGKTNTLLSLLYGLASRYSPEELGLYLLDFKEGVSFVEFTPTRADPSWIPHAHTVGIESDREYGLAVLRALGREMNRRASALKRAGVTKLGDLRAVDGPVLPRLVAVIDEFQVLLAGNDTIAREAVAALEDLARKGRSYGIHLILASQTISGIEALYTKTDSIFGQFPLRVALPGGSAILDPLNTAADALPVGSAIVNDAAGAVGANKPVRLPHADPASVAAQRQRLWQARPPENRPPAVFAGYAEHHIEQDPLYTSLGPQVRRRQALVGRAVDIGLPTVGFGMDAVPGRHVAVLGPSIVGADVLHAATAGLARQHDPGSARFVLAGFAAAADPVLDELVAELTGAGHDCTEADAGQLRGILAELAAQPATGTGTGKPTYLVLFAADVMVPMLGERGPDSRTGLDHLRTVLRQGPTYGLHTLIWWRTARRFGEVLGGSSGREDVACLVALNVPGNELASLLGDHTLTWQPRPNRALLIDRHDQRRQLIVPFVRPGRHEEYEETGAT
jgi:DNA segregation ATPase FtsK/SpoIIIE, S-DNA-T family